jgi:predicted dehydrogenase
MPSAASRRTFLKTSLAIGSGLALSARSYARVQGANDDIRIAVVGFGGRGGEHIKSWTTLKGVRLVSLCDCDDAILAAGVKRVEDAAGFKPAACTDVRKLLESKDLDAISTATPNHWHALITVWGCQAGKDVYCEKPISHNIFEGRKAVEAARKYNRIVQAGTQSRSSLKGVGEAVAWVQGGNLGKIVMARGLCYKRRPSIGKVDGPQPIPKGVDYDLWCGPAEKLPLMREKLHYDWHWVWNTGCGDLGNQGIHQMDIARWFLGESSLAPRVWSLGGRVGYVDDGETPNTQISYYGYEKAPLLFEVRGLPAKTGTETMDVYGDLGHNVGVVIHCEGGHLTVPGYSGTSTVAYDSAGKEIKRWKGDGDHFANFLKAVRSRKVSDLNADIEEGHLSSGLCHQGNIAYRLGAEASPDAIRDAIRHDAGAAETFERVEKHLAANGVSLSQTTLAIGPTLKFDPKAERFTQNDRANALLTRPYRPGFVVPETV